MIITPSPTCRYTLPIEMAAARAILDGSHETFNVLYPYRGQQHIRIRKHQYGIINAAYVVTNMKRTFTAIRVGVMVGVPSKVDVRLGDIVVGTRVMQTDLGKIAGDEHFKNSSSIAWDGRVCPPRETRTRAESGRIPVYSVHWLCQSSRRTHGA